MLNVSRAKALLNSIFRSITLEGHSKVYYNFLGWSKGFCTTGLTMWNRHILDLRPCIFLIFFSRIHLSFQIWKYNSLPQFIANKMQENEECGLPHTNIWPHPITFRILLPWAKQNSAHTKPAIKEKGTIHKMAQTLWLKQSPNKIPMGSPKQL